jgi:hypothetical protein
MTLLRLVRAASDGQHLIVASQDGEEYELLVTDDVRTAIRQMRTHAPQESPTSSLTPREIQQRIRGGLNAAELAELTGEPFEALTKFEGPVLAERAYICDLARDTRIGSESDAPLLGDLVTDRLASRAVDPESIVWDAWRQVDEPWQVAVDFVTGGKTVRALWTFDHSGRAVTAEDDESRWLTETELLDVPIPKRHLSAVREGSDDVLPLHPSRPSVPEVSASVTADDSAAADLLDELDRTRGQRESLSADDEDDLGPMALGTIGAGMTRVGMTGVGMTGMGMTGGGNAGAPTPHPAGSALRKPTTPEARGEAGDEAPESNAQDSTGSSGPKEPKAAKKGRASVPSWDEIVFGAKND